MAGAAFAYAPFRLEQDGHMQVISAAASRVTLALGVRALRLQRPWLLIAAAAVAAWQVSIGFAIGLPFTYLLALLAAIGAVVWWRRGRPAIDRRMLIAGIAGAAIFAVIVSLISLPYFRVADAHPEATRPPSTVEEFSGPLSVFLLSSEESFVWGPVTQGLFDEVNNPVEKTLFPGLLILILAIVGLRSSSLPRQLRIGLGVGVLALSVLELGFQEEGGWLWPYRIVYEVLPGWEAIRTPGRLATFSTLALALLAGAGAESTLRAAKRRLERRSPSPRVAAALPVALVCALALVIVVEGRGLPFDPIDKQDQPALDPEPPSVADVPDPQLHLPAEGGEENRRYLFWSTDGFPLIVNGRASTRPDSIERLIISMRDFPNRGHRRAPAASTGCGASSCTPTGAAAWPQFGAEYKPVDGLGLTVSRRGPLVIYELEPERGLGRRGGGRGLPARPRRLAGLIAALASRQQRQGQQRGRRRPPPPGRSRSGRRPGASPRRRRCWDRRRRSPPSRAPPRRPSAGRPAEVYGVALAASTIAATTAATTGAIATQAFETPTTLSSVCSKRPSTMNSTQVPGPCSPSSG